MPIDVTTYQDLRATTLPQSAFAELALRERLRHVRRVGFPARPMRSEQFDALGDVLLTERHEDGLTLLLRTGDGFLIVLGSTRGHGVVGVAGEDADAVDRLVDELVAQLRDDERREDDRVSVTFWAGGGAPWMNPRRRIAAPRWAEVVANYAAPTREGLGALVAARAPGPGGLLLWHGEPGTGKSYALRALAREWRGWCDVHYITDPEAFLGSQSSQLLNALLRSDRGRNRLLVLEDAGELLAADARVQAGQALSRLLNVTDGLLGTGLGSIVLVTTNEPLRKLHPAVVRPGRCWAEVEFARLSVDEGNVWLEARGADACVGRPVTIAELFALADGRAVAAPASTGFAA